MSQFHAPIGTNAEGNLPVRQLAAGMGIWPTLQALLVLAVEPQMKLINLAHGHPPRGKSHSIAT